MSWPGESGALPWMASNMATCSPMLALPASPTLPVNLGGDVGEDVAVEVGHHDHVEALGRVGQPGRADVDDLVLLSRCPGTRRADLVEDLVEQAVGHLHDVVLRSCR